MFTGKHWGNTLYDDHGRIKPRLPDGPLHSDILNILESFKDCYSHQWAKDWHQRVIDRTTDYFKEPHHG